MTMTHKAQPYKAHFGPFAPDVYRLPFPNPYREPMRFADWERRFKALLDPEEVAAVVVEPVQGEGGFVVPTEEFLPELREFCSRHGIVLVADEVQTGIGRTGTFFASEQFGIEPDLICVGKALASGLPLSGVVGVADVIDSVPDSAIGGTYVGNPVACAAGLAVIDVLEEQGLLERARRLGERLEARFLELKKRYALVGDVRGLGAMRAIELVRDRETKEPAPEETALLSRMRSWSAAWTRSRPRWPRSPAAELSQPGGRRIAGAGRENQASASGPARQGRTTRSRRAPGHPRTARSRGRGRPDVLPRGAPPAVRWGRLPGIWRPPGGRDS